MSRAAGLTEWQRGFGLPATGVRQAFADPARDSELRGLKAQADRFEEALKEIRKRIDELETKK